jgi:hypothetical protein
MSELHTWMKHSEHGGVWESPTALVEHYKAYGWEVMDDTPTPVDTAVVEAAETAEAAGPAGFDPGEHTVAEVQEYLAEHPDDEDRVLDAELAGKNRVTLTLGPDDDVQ